MSEESATVAWLEPGDIITIPRDQYGRPVRGMDPATRQPLETLQAFVVVSVDGPLTKLQPIGQPVRAWQELRSMVYLGKAKAPEPPDPPVPFVVMTVPPGTLKEPSKP